MTNVVEGDLLNVGRDVLEMSGDGGTPRIDSICGRVRCQLEGPSGLTVTGTRDYQDNDNGNQNEAFLEVILPATMASDSASRAWTALASSSAM